MILYYQIKSSLKRLVKFGGETIIDLLAVAKRIMDFRTTLNSMKNIITHFVIYPAGQYGTNASTEALLRDAAEMAAAIGRPRPTDYSSGGVVCDPHDQLELVITPLGGPDDMLAVQVYRDGKVVFVGLGQADRCYGCDRTVHLITKSNKYGLACVHYTLFWIEK